RLDDHRKKHSRVVESGWDPLGTGPKHIDPDRIDGARDRRWVRNIQPQNENQARLMEAIGRCTMTLALGPAGAGKTYLAVAAAVTALEQGTVARIVLSRPAVEAGENLGYLLGSMEDKLHPYLRPLYDALGERVGGKRLKALTT